MVSSLPPSATQSLFRPPSVWQLSLKAWLRDGHDLDIEHMLGEYGVHLAGLTPECEVGSNPIQKLPKKQRRHAEGYSSASFLSTPGGRLVILHLGLCLNNPEPAHKCQHADAEHEMDHNELDWILMEATWLASLEQFAVKNGTLDDVNLSAGTSTGGNELHSKARCAVHSRSPTPLIEYNAHGCVTARSKGKGQAN